jgi:protease I
MANRHRDQMGKKGQPPARPIAGVGPVGAAARVPARAARSASARAMPRPGREVKPREARGKVAVILGESFEDSEFRVPYDRLKREGYEPVVIGVNRRKTLTGKAGRVKVKPDHNVDEVSPTEFEAVVIPGGYSPDHLRTDPRMVSLTREIFVTGKPVAAVCHAGSMLIEADIVDGRTVTSWPSIKTDLINAGARWVDREVVEDGNLITARKPEDLLAFTDALLRQLERWRVEALSPPSLAERVPHEHPEVPD